MLRRHLYAGKNRDTTMETHIPLRHKDGGQVNPLSPTHNTLAAEGTCEARLKTSPLVWKQVCLREGSRGVCVFPVGI